MANRRWIAALLALWLGADSGSVSTAKPPDLPANNEVRCEDTEPGRLRVQWDATGLGRVEIEGPAATADMEPPVCIDAWCSQLLPLIAQRLCQRMLVIAQPCSADADGSQLRPDIGMPARDDATHDAVRSAFDPRFAATAQKARLLYELASRCAREGKLAEARAHLREAHLANPTCRFGRLAIERLQELEALPPAEEQQSDDDEAVQAERAFRRMRETTQPLGLVQPLTY